ncbi:hypothetical protein A2331_03005 [Candidatus Falkowbacteria bacterium RIFOXYB2_FULL_34_18]|uniref:Uncharacterized protein n=1 Tax=Candidatus Falkowbacteria bacterium RIFOXYD2_FULL_34_120 TaxID=1798007 RepID=A0A1F5TMD8_9BACT|nr:MAG: hypothetical protein A2331_03005 [Candidatus Falkowbacteria bacterium RIFOXYB2_FULL_34_18]OGF28323.1 MAG: hypothetical protein A2500_02935 [Candidatus Falkowbacteria bacterium RIFOXYC12_FULL_34_55]OGF37958.1 MAG: hypothetical protein A2466_06150 [Candidatus Falkowbacteria bacterium RIFOXYC2_FULL_34_220]OGF39676.1 MAG: hypothetical protein A2515_07445 [Candidatus Falkowbacteria bacterium RIFOXYD12_FULL_34_57]OGF40115.1 MAG: hypothetical protein A2531_05140 [Candidatus Falkowbacteria bact
MKLIINKNQINENPEQFLRRAGYGFIQDRRSGNESFVRRLTRDFYPRLHMYVDKKDTEVIFNLHLDQKQASYAGAHMHNAEYDGEIVEREIERLKILINSAADKISSGNIKQEDVFDKVGDGSLEKSKNVKEKISWFKKIFG